MSNNNYYYIRCIPIHISEIPTANTSEAFFN